MEPKDNWTSGQCGRRRRVAKGLDDSLSRPGYSHSGFSRPQGRAVINSIKINGYRGFEDFSVHSLGRINLLVGKNNCGKTSVLESLSLLSAGSDLGALWRVLTRRGEQPAIEVQPGRGVQQEVDISHLFMGHAAQVGTEFSISTTNQKPGKSIKYKLEEAKPVENVGLFNLLTSDGTGVSPIALRISSGSAAAPQVPLTRRLGLRNDIYANALNVMRTSKLGMGSAQYITTESLTMQEIINLWGTIALTQFEDTVISALKFLEPGIERLAVLPNTIYYGQSGRGGFVVKQSGVDQPVPIGSFGDGVWRMFSLAVAISRAQDSVLLIDEIDTGLHYSVMDDMWKFVDKVSKALNVQVFATTHSYDCIQSLSGICADHEDAGEITIQRIEAGKGESIPFSEAEIKVAAVRKIEIR